MAAKKKRKAAAPRKPKKRAGPSVKKKTARTKRKARPAAAVLDNTPPPFRPSQAPSMDWGNNSLEVAAQIAAWRHARMNAPLSTGGAVEPVPFPLDSLPPVMPQPDLTRTAGPQLSAVSPIPDVAGLNHDEVVEVIKEWFFSNFEDPAQSTPRNDGEFEYIWGGPYDARDEISDAFSGNAPEEVIEEAIRAVEAEGIGDWAPHGNRGQPDYDEQADAGASDPNALHAEMIERIEALEQAMADLDKHRQLGIGHNNPPEPIDLLPLSEKELDEIREDLAVLKRQPPAPITPSTEATAAVLRLTTFADRLRPLARAAGAYLAKQADNFVTEAVKEAGKRIVQSPLWLPIIYKLPTLADIAHQWLQSLGPHL